MTITTTLRAGPFEIRHHFEHRYDQQWVWMHTHDNGWVAHLRYKSEREAVAACEQEHGKQQWTRVGASSEAIHASSALGTVRLTLEDCGTLAETLRAALAECEAQDRGLL